MNAKQFRFQYLLSLCLTILSVVIFVAAVVMFLFSSTQSLISELSMNNPDALAKTIWDIIIYLLINSVYAMLAIGMYCVGVIWNIIVSVRRANTQDDHSLTVVVIVGWTSSVLLPVLGLVVSLVAQIWGWFKGSKETNIITS